MHLKKSYGGRICPTVIAVFRLSILRQDIIFVLFLLQICCKNQKLGKIPPPLPKNEPYIHDDAAQKVTWTLSLIEELDIIPSHVIFQEARWHRRDMGM